METLVGSSVNGKSAGLGEPMRPEVGRKPKNR
jgi:hypothetical protein